MSIENGMLNTNHQNLYQQIHQRLHWFALLEDTWVARQNKSTKTEANIGYATDVETLRKVARGEKSKINGIVKNVYLKWKKQERLKNEETNELLSYSVWGSTPY